MDAGAVSSDNFMALSLTVLDRLHCTVRDLSAQMESWSAAFQGRPDAETGLSRPALAMHFQGGNGHDSFTVNT